VRTPAWPSASEDTNPPTRTHLHRHVRNEEQAVAKDAEDVVLGRRNDGGNVLHIAAGDGRASAQPTGDAPTVPMAAHPTHLLPAMLSRLFPKRVAHRPRRRALKVLLNDNYAAVHQWQRAQQASQTQRAQHTPATAATRTTTPRARQTTVLATRLRFPRHTHACESHTTHPAALMMNSEWIIAFAKHCTAAAPVRLQTTEVCTRIHSYALSMERSGAEQCGR
jgi:hypothetical protein